MWDPCILLLVQAVLATGNVTPELLAALAALPVPPEGAGASTAAAGPASVARPSASPAAAPAASPRREGLDATPGTVLAKAQAAMAPLLAGGVGPGDRTGTPPTASAEGGGPSTSSAAEGRPLAQGRAVTGGEAGGLPPSGQLQLGSPMSIQV